MIIKKINLLIVFICTILISINTHGQDSPLIGGKWKVIHTDNGSSTWITLEFNPNGTEIFELYQDGVLLKRESSLYYFSNKVEEQFDHDKIGKLSNGKYIMSDDGLCSQIIILNYNSFKIKGVSEQANIWIIFERE